MTGGFLFAGIGGFELAAQWAGIEPVWSNEIDKFCCQVLRKNFKHRIIEDDIRNIGKHNLEAVDIICGGPPCQPASQAGKRKGEKDNRWLWPEAIRVFGELRPKFGLFENPDDILTLDNGEPFESICSALENFGYKVETFGIPAACVGAWHERDRVWIIAHSNDSYDQGKLDAGTNKSQAKAGQRKNTSQRQTLDRQRIWDEPGTEAETISDSNTHGLQVATQTELGSISEKNGASAWRELGRAFATPGRYWEAEPGVGRMVHGLPNRVDRIKALGNAIVPQVSYEIFKAIIEYDARPRNKS